ncbi:AAI domain-containing protein [Heracleum sosnowskyi]|uniref:AAI domain-containing protein n=1 Tax=Heracleum sosnowskyi TaxID=360622 RepID=A0AAD8J9A3_9APIA|nr:AAI domain-containing protein [Heracleum sosnowskyi]
MSSALTNETHGVFILSITFVNGQITTPCTNPMITSFTPCLNYLTGSTGTGGSPIGDCCGALRSLTSTSMDCACLIVTGNVPFSLPINRTLAISLPKSCRASGVKGVPVQCKEFKTSPYMRYKNDVETGTSGFGDDDDMDDDDDEDESEEDDKEKQAAHNRLN